MERFNPFKRYQSFNGNYNRLLIENTSICNFNCRHCAYGKKKTAKKTMTLEFFKDVIDKACDFGFTHFSIAPLTGEPLLDKGLKEKIEYLDEHSGVDTYYMFTNLSRPINFLKRAKKLVYLGVSLYGKDKYEFIHTTRASERSYDIVMRNIEKLREFRCAVYIKLYTNSSRERQRLILDSEVYRNVLQNTPSLYKIEVVIPKENWCGMISEEDTGYEMNRPPETETLNRKPCYVMLCKNMVNVEGKLVGCGCFDANYMTSFADINDPNYDLHFAFNSISYKGLLKRPHPICTFCSAYKSIEEKEFGNTNSAALKEALYKRLWKDYFGE